MAMDMSAFRLSTKAESPPAHVTGPLAALWWSAKGDWERAHAIVQSEATKEAAWVHAYLHRVEGDLSNARYWYAQAGRPAATKALDAEWEAIAGVLLRSREDVEQ